jgi:hypothetical protein
MKIGKPAGKVESGMLGMRAVYSILYFGGNKKNRNSVIAKPGFPAEAIALKPSRR